MVYNYYTDGACTLKNTKIDGKTVYDKGPGGWGVVLVGKDNTVIAKRSGGKPATTNNEMELMAIYNAIRDFLESKRFSEGAATINIYSDSAYCINIFTQWAKSWEANGWKRGKKKEPIQNLELVKAIYEFVKSFNSGFNSINFIKVHGHSGDEFNEMADKLAVSEKLTFTSKVE